MVLEITGARIIAPFVGGSLVAWTSLIGVILTFLSIGYVLGGKLADTNPSYKFLSALYFLISISIFIIPMADSTILLAVTMISSSIKISSVLGCIALFAIPSIFLGIAAPYLIRLKLTNPKKSGETVGILYALSTLGSIFGTFFSGFFLFSIMGSSQVLFLLSGVSLIIALSLALISKNKILIPMIILCLGIATFISNSSLSRQEGQTYETSYSKVKLIKADYFGKEMLIMMSGNVPMSGMYIDSDELLYDYTKFFRLISHFNTDPKKVLMIGGGGYSYPKDFHKTYPDSEIDVIELDPKLTEIARANFNLPESEKLKIFHEDARTYINKTDLKYDAVVIDAFSSSTAVPFQLTTIEFFTKLHKNLRDDGVIIMNTISALEGSQGKFLRSEYSTLKSIFPYVYIIPVSQPQNDTAVQNVILVATKNEIKTSSENPEMQKYLSHIWTKELSGDSKILTDDYAPVEQYEIETLQ